MPFELKVSFSGIIAFTPNPDGHGVRVLFPNTLFGGYDSNGVFKPDAASVRPALDRRPLARHYPRISGRALGGRYHCINEERIEFAFDGGGSGLMSNLAQVISMDTLWGADDMDSVARENPSSSPLVCGHIDIDYGELETGKATSWMIPGYLRNKGAGDDAVVSCYSARVDWTIPGINRATVRVLPYAGGVAHVWVIDRPSELGIVNHCSAPWEALPDPLKHRLPDDDFRWHYELLSSDAKARLRSLIKPQGLPIPYPDTHGECDGETAADVMRAESALLPMYPPWGNCMPTTWP